MDEEFQWLDVTTIAALRDAAIQVGLSRDSLLGGLPRSLSASMPKHGNLATQLLEDLRYLSAIEDLGNGFVPLRSWLDTAVLLSGLRREAKTFKAALAKMNGPVPQGPPIQNDRGSPGLLWRASSVAALWRHPDAAELVSIMKNYASPRDLRAVALHVGFDVAQVSWEQELDAAARELIERSFKSTDLESILRAMRKDPHLRRWHDALEKILTRPA